MAFQAAIPHDSPASNANTFEYIVNFGHEAGVAPPSKEARRIFNTGTTPEQQQILAIAAEAKAKGLVGLS